MSLVNIGGDYMDENIWLEYPNSSFMKKENILH